MESHGLTGRINGRSLRLAESIGCLSHSSATSLAKFVLQNSFIAVVQHHRASHPRVSIKYIKPHGIKILAPFDMVHCTSWPSVEPKPQDDRACSGL